MELNGKSLAKNSWTIRERVGKKFEVQLHFLFFSSACRVKNISAPSIETVVIEDYLCKLFLFFKTSAIIILINIHH